MASGPPASAAESSKVAEQTQNTPQNTPLGSSNASTTRTSAGSPSQNPYASLATTMNPSRVQQQPYSAHTHMNPQNNWPMYPSRASGVPLASHYPQYTYGSYHGHYYPVPIQPTGAPPGPSSLTDIPTSDPRTTEVSMGKGDGLPQSPSPPPPKYEHWDEALREFLREARLVQALKGFECDMLVLNSEWEYTKVPLALERLIKSLSNTREFQSPKGKEKELPTITVEEPARVEDDRGLDDRKLDYIHLANGEKARTPTSINKEISAFLARNRARNDASNRAEFLLGLSEKRKRSREDDGETEDDPAPSCARTDAKTIDRDAQMKYDIAKNDDGPLRRTKAKRGDVQPSVTRLDPDAKPPGSATGVLVPSDQDALSKHHPGIDERLANIETHLAVRYVPSPPRTLWARLKFLEDHIVRLEKDYPPWAALHFNQPNRGWPPPPRATPIIVPPHLRSSDVEAASSAKAGSQPGQQGSISTPSPTVAGAPKTRNTKSSLQRAVLERLQVQQAMGEK